ncbi:MAG: NotI family restriction endonuclease, partial [Blastocatellia bacterium]
LNDKHGKSAGNIDIVLVAYDERGRVIDFGSLEIQAVYISGNVRLPFENFMQKSNARTELDWTGQPNYPRPDYPSSSRKRLAPQLLFKGGIFHAWRKKQAVALHRGFYDTLPRLPVVEPEQADLAWLVYDLRYDTQTNRYLLCQAETIYTKFESAMLKITTADPGDVSDFVGLLQSKLDEKLDNNPPDAPTLSDKALT